MEIICRCNYSKSRLTHVSPWQEDALFNAAHRSVAQVKTAGTLIQQKILIRQMADKPLHCTFWLSSSVSTFPLARKRRPLRSFPPFGGLFGRQLQKNRPFQLLIGLFGPKSDFIPHHVDKHFLPLTPSANVNDYHRLQEAIYARLTERTTWYIFSQGCNLSVVKLRRAYNSWLSNGVKSQPQGAEDIYFSLRNRDRPVLIPPHHSTVIVDSIKYFADNNTSLTRASVQELIRTYVEMLEDRQNANIDLGDHGLSDNCINSLMERYELKYMSVQAVVEERLQAMTPAIFLEPIARIQAAIDLYHILDPRFIFNTDQSGSSLKRMCGRCLRKGFGKKDRKLQQACVLKKGQLERRTVMPCVSPAGRAYKPVIVFPGVNPHYRKIKGVLQGPHAVLPDCYLQYREIPGADSAIVHYWEKHFVEETTSLRENGQYLLLILDGYSVHIQFATLNHFRLNRIVVIGLPAHSSHRLQPLDVSVFNSYKSFLQSFLHSAAMVKIVINAFDLGSLISNAYDKSMVGSNIRSGFEKCEIWDGDKMGTDVQVLEHLFEERGKYEKKRTMEGLIRAFLKKGRSLLRNANVEEEVWRYGTASMGCVYTAHVCLV